MRQNKEVPCKEGTSCIIMKKIEEKKSELSGKGELLKNGRDTEDRSV
jgi:hypothetical protein